MYPCTEKDRWKKSWKKRVKKDKPAQRRIEKKIKRIREDPDRIGDGKTGKFKGLKSVAVHPWVILFEVVRDDENKPASIKLWDLKHHNDSDYDP